MLELGKRADVVFLSLQSVFHPGIVGTADTCQVDVAVPVVGVTAGRIVAETLEGFQHALIGRLDDAGAEAILILIPSGVSLEPRLLLRQHLDDAVGRAVQHALARSDLRGFERL